MRRSPITAPAYEPAIESADAHIRAAEWIKEVADVGIRAPIQLRFQGQRAVKPWRRLTKRRKGRQVLDCGDEVCGVAALALGAAHTG